MSKAIVQTHAGDDTDGRIWGIEGMNILFILAGLLLSVSLALLLVRHNPPAFSVGVGALPFVLTVIGLGLAWSRSEEPLSAVFWRRRPILLLSAAILVGGGIGVLQRVLTRPQA